MRQLTEKIKVRENYNWRKNKDFIPQFLNFETKNQYNFGAVEVSGYDYYLAGINNFNDNFFIPKIRAEEETKILKYLASINLDENKLLIFNQKGKGTDNREIIETFDLNNIFTEILNTKEKEALENNNGYYLDNDKLTFKLEGKKLNIKVHFNHIAIPNPAWTKEIQEKQKEKSDFIFHNSRGYVNGEIWIKVK